ncbi:hypothetical protein DFH04_07570 [Clostridium novyi]|uniref:hypothetical protein n=1 Tax=Clostridium novyi TaxID=1542 RepID=UPI000EA32ECF|nr:hypothetical protein [Clostridium novyi]AYF54571.1 hypothetical protein DFH04_07570 [Clostridium novyi]
MYKGFKLEEDFRLKEMLQKYKKIGSDMWGEKKESIKTTLEGYIRGDNFIDCSKLQEDWFPMVQSDIFISHSHNDIDVVDGLAGWFYEEMGLNSFVDSHIWNYCNDLLREIDEKYCLHSNEESFDYDKRNYSTTHVHMMLANSLNRMIDKSECVIFFETPNSINPKNIIKEETNSAWIYSEIMTTGIIRKNIPSRFKHGKNIENKSFNAQLNESFKPIYELDTGHLIKITYDDLKSMLGDRELQLETDYLDRLYKIAQKRRLITTNAD